MDEKTRKLLERPFPSEFIKQRVGPNGLTLSYVGLQHYVDRLNEAFAHEWSYEVTRRDQVEDQVLVEVRLTAGGVIKTGLGGATVTRRRDNGKLVSLADDFKKAEADALKRACRLLSIAATLYGGGEEPDGDADEGPPDDGWSKPRPRNGNAATQAAPLPPARAASRPPTPSSTERSRLTARQLAALWSIARNQGIDEGSFRARVTDEYHVQPEFLTKSQASQLIGAMSANGSHPPTA